MKTITVTACSRPVYLRQALESLRKNDVGQYKLFFGIEPGSGEVLEVCKSVDWMEKDITVNPRKLGVRVNPFTLLTKVFKEGSELNIYLEEDVVVSPDVTKLADWFLEAQREESWLSLNLLNYKSTNTDPIGLLPSKHFNSLGLCIKPHAWKTWFEPNWLSDTAAQKVYQGRSVGWDWSMTAVLALEKDLQTLTPVLSRSNHIGREGGVHASPDFHDRTFPHLPINQDPSPGAYRINHA